MKRLIILLTIIPALVFAVEPERILPKTLVIKPRVWYASQKYAWAAEVKQNNSPQAWFSYYASAVYAQSSREELSDLLTQMSISIPEAYEYWLAKSWHDAFNAESYEALKRAYALQPEKPEGLGLMQLYAEFAMDQSIRAQFSKRLYNKGQVSPALLNYSYNVLMSLEPGAVLITEGESTTIPLFVLQDAFGIRKDVVILNLEMLNNADYVHSKFVQSGLNSVEVRKDVANPSSWICAQLPQTNQNKKFYYALTVSKDNIQSIKEYLYVVGLASVHSAGSVDNVSLIRENLEKKFLLDYLRVDFNGEVDSDAGRAFSSNYLLPMILLYESYQTGGEVEKAKNLRLIMEKIATDAGKREMILHYLDAVPTETIPYIPFAIDVKSWEEDFRPVSTTIYAANTEVTNAQYNRFLEFLQTNKLTDLYEQFKFDFSRYEEPALAFMTNYALPRTETKKNRYFNHYPAVNITYEAANAYCDWLTQQYNNATERKFKKVRFRLPTIDEWQIAAASIKNPATWKLDEQEVEVKITPQGSEFDKNPEIRKVSLRDPEIQYPWFRYFGLRNSPLNNKSCYLGNFKSEPCDCPGYRGNKPTNHDGWAAMAPTKSYFPNDIGLYDVVGNVAEMSSEKGKACGGSWNHSPAESTMRSINAYTNPDAAVGFRVFMEIIEK
ncbi:MAG: SUMF1/EgtB/PvdO family nonheme iron enzyme [Cyclobacteriaceae bacterium]|nr:SUMF1/EgtB/PvdO family nonheme iron enzyme [Cyclobacteriaceae bacterium]